MPNSSSQDVVRIWIFFMGTSIVVLSTQMWNTKIRFWKLLIESNCPKKMARSSFGRKFHTLYYFELYFFICLEFILHLRSSSSFLNRELSIECNFIVLQQHFKRYLFNITTCTPTCTVFLNTPSVSYQKLRFTKYVELRSFFAFLARNCVRCIALTKHFPVS